MYNPKEARLRKAMREQCRELSRQSILQSTVTTTSGNASATGANSTNGSVGERGVAGVGVGAGSGGGGGGGGGNRSGSAGVEISGSGNFLSHPMSSGASPAPATAVSVSSLPSSSSGYNTGRIINPWFPVGHTGPASHIKPMLSHRVSFIFIILLFNYCLFIFISDTGNKKLKHKSINKYFVFSFKKKNINPKIDR